MAPPKFGELRIVLRLEVLELLRQSFDSPFELRDHHTPVDYSPSPQSRGWRALIPNVTDPKLGKKTSKGLTRN